MSNPPNDQPSLLSDRLWKMHYSGTRPDDGREPGPVEAFFWDNHGQPVHKWHHYLPLYDRYFAPYRDRPIRMLEIGVHLGGSLSLWRRYFGPDAVLFGIDINPDCAKVNGLAAQVRIGSQADPDFLNQVVDEMGGIDIVLDDGSHDSSHIRASFTTLFPRLADGGIYVIEDLHAAYWPDYSGGYAAQGSFFTDIKTMIDDMHHWYHDEGERIAAAAGHLAGLHVHDSLVVLEKRRVPSPMHTSQGNLEKMRARQEAAARKLAQQQQE